MRVVTTAALAALLAAPLHAATHEVQMLNRGETGAMVFEPAYIAAEPGDEIVMLPTDRGHNVESVKGMLPEGVESFRSGFDEEFRLTVTEEGVYGIKCTPHVGMGMVALVQVGTPVNLDDAKAVRQRGKAAQRFDDLFARVAE